MGSSVVGTVVSSLGSLLASLSVSATVIAVESPAVPAAGAGCPFVCGSTEPPAPGTSLLCSCAGGGAFSR